MKVFVALVSFVLCHELAKGWDMIIPGPCPSEFTDMFPLKEEYTGVMTDYHVHENKCFLQDWFADDKWFIMAPEYHIPNGFFSYKRKNDAWFSDDYFEDGQFTAVGKFLEISGGVVCCDELTPIEHVYPVYRGEEDEPTTTTVASVSEPTGHMYWINYSVNSTIKEEEVRKYAPLFCSNVCDHTKVVSDAAEPISDGDELPNPYFQAKTETSASTTEAPTTKV